MMTKSLVKLQLLTLLTVGLYFVASASGLFAEEQGHGSHSSHGGHKKGHSAHKMGHHKAKGKEQMIKGRVIGLTCFLQHNAQGEKHKNCARMCAENGLPLGLMSEDHQIYLIMGEGHEPPNETNKKLLKYVESKVMVKAKLIQNHGIKAIIVNKIKKI